MEYVCVKSYARGGSRYQIGTVDQGKFRPAYETDKYVCAERFLRYLNCKTLTRDVETNAKICTGMLRIGWVRPIGGKK